MEPAKATRLSSGETELERLAEQTKKNYLETAQEVEDISQELKSLEARDAEATEAMSVSSEALDSAKDQIKRVREMIAKANLLLSKAEPKCRAEIIRLKKLKAQIQQLEAEKRMTLERLKSCLDTMTAEIYRGALKAQALLKVEEERKTMMSAFETKIKSYERNT